MLYYLFEWLHKLNFPGAGMFGYTSFRALMAVILALLISSIWGDKFINLLKRKQITETQRDAKTDPFGVNKVGVPSMGGVTIIVAILIPCLLLGKLHNIYMILMLITTIWLGSLGFADDYIKIFKRDKEGLHGKFKIIGQVGLGLIVGMTLYLSPDVVIRENIEVHNPGREMEVIHGTNDLKSTQTTIPFFKSNNLDYADLVSFMGEHAQTAGWILFVIVTIIVVTAVSNGANLNDGMDGMAAGNSAIIGASMGIYIFSWPVLKEALIKMKDEPGCDFGKHIIPYCHENKQRLFAYEFNGYWKDVGTLGSYWEANMELIDIIPEFNLYEEFWKIYTKSDILPPQYLADNSKVFRSIVGEGTQVYGEVYNSVIGSGVIIEEGAIVRDSIIMQNARIGAGAVIDKSIIAESTEIGEGAVLGVGDEAPNTLNAKVYAFGLVTIGENSYIPPRVQIGKNTAIYGVTELSDYENGMLPSGGSIIKGGAAR